MMAFEINLPNETWNEKQRYKSLQIGCEVFRLKQDELLTNREVAEEMGMSALHVERRYTKIVKAIHAGDVSVVSRNMR